MTWKKKEKKNINTENQEPLTEQETESTDEDTSVPVTDLDKQRVDESSEEAESEPQISEEERLAAKVQQLEDEKLLALADLDNYKKRMARQFDGMTRRANDQLLGDILEIIDNFERALQHGGESVTKTDDSSSPDKAALQQGTELIYNQMIDLLGKYDVKPIESLGRAFDPNFHEALMQIHSEDYEEGIVAAEVSKGYMQGDRVLRFAKVGVSKGKAEPEKSETSSDVEN